MKLKFTVIFIIFLTFMFSCKRDNGEFPGESADSTDRVSQQDALKTFINNQMEEKHIPGLAACIIKNNGVVWAEGFGFADIANQKAVTPETVFMLASISKTITAVAAMQAVDNGILALDTDINNYLTFTVKNPSFPGRTITLRHLLTHTSSIADNDDITEDYYSTGDSPVALGVFLSDYLDADGDEYDAGGNYNSWAPGTRYQYSNIGSALIGYLVEAAAQIDFSLYCKQNIFQPLGMTETGWHLEGLTLDNIAIPYVYRNGTFEAQQHYGFPDYPNGSLRTSISGLARFLLMFMNSGAYKGTVILDCQWIADMHRVQFPELDADQGLSWYYMTLGDWRLLGHSGGETGVTTEMYYRPADSVGVIVLTNGDDLLLDNILIRLFQEAENM
ncbi:MAG: beta-lactamase family protein [bacterium]|nr:beta-lactamase family protein [bacterium]